MEEEIRAAAFQWLNRYSEKTGNIFRRNDLARGFEFDGRRITLVGPTGIWFPMGFEIPISITTIPDGPYDDGFAEDGILRYSYRGTDPHHRDNQGLRRAYHERTPLIYFQAFRPGLYVAAWPLFILRDNPSELCIEAAMDVSLTGVQNLMSPNEEFYSQSDSILSVRRYVTRITRQRMHQSAFREFVLDAYDRRCTICRLQHPELLDAAHIIPDSREDGLPIVPNGLSLCKIHHSAFDQNILGISPDYTVHIRRDLLDEIDGPMLKHGFQELDSNVIHIPLQKKNRPDKERLDIRFSEFLSA